MKFIELQKREMETGEQPYVLAEWDEIGGEIDYSKHDNRLMANHALHRNIGDGWYIFQMTPHNDQAFAVEIRSDRGHLALAVIGVSRQQCKFIMDQLLKTFEIN